MPKVYPRIRALREDRELTQTQVAQKIGCSQRVYSNYERGETSIPPEILIGIADYHRVSIDYLLGRTNKHEVNR